MTKLFDNDPYLFNITARVSGCESCKEGFKVFLDQTIFFPRGGGQPADRGTIDGIAVLDVYEELDQIIHLLPQEIPVGTPVLCQLDQGFRLDSMQQHLGQHIFSRIAELDYGAHTVAARIEDGVSHVELDMPLTYDQLYALECRVNGVIGEDLPVRTDCYTKEEGAKLGLPAKAFTHEIIRVVTIEGLDQNPCGGTHPKSTGEVLGCVITGLKEVRGAYRIYYKFGGRALSDRREAVGVFLDCQAAFGIFDKAELPGHIAALQEKTDKLTKELAELKIQLTCSDCQNLLNSSETLGELHLITANLEEKGHIKLAIDKLVLENNAMVLLTNKIGDTLSLSLTQSKNGSKVNLGGYVRDFLSQYQGKGGGGNAAAQCNVPYTDEALATAQELFKKIKHELA